MLKSKTKICSLTYSYFLTFYKNDWCNVTFLAPTYYINSSNHSLLAAGDQLVVPRGVTRISCHCKNTIEGTGENKTNEQTRTMLGVNSIAKRGVMQHYISESIYGRTLAWITSENSTKQLECRHLDSIFFAGPYLPCYCVRSQPHLSLSRRQLFFSSLLQPLSSRVPLPLPATPRFQVQKPFVWFRAKTDKGIVCWVGHLYSVTYSPSYPCHLFTINYNTEIKQNKGIIQT